jgi:Holliday junction resolvase RusA-like endonuclease
MPELVITVYGTPAPQGSKRHVGNGVMIEMSKRVRPWRNDVMIAAQAWRDEHPRAPLTGPLALAIDFYFRRPKKHYRTGRRAAELRDDAPEYHYQVPDLSKLIRSTEDALTDSGIWADDCLVAAVHARKRWAGHDSGTLPGAVITIREQATA